MIEIINPSPSLYAPETQDMLFDLLEASGNREAVGNLLHMVGAAAAHSDYMQGPVMVMEVDPAGISAQTSHHPPPWLVRAVERDRLQLIIEENQTGILTPWATPTEVFAYLRPSLHCTGDWPLQDEWTRLLLWARDHSFHRHMELIIAAENNDGPVDYVDKVPNSEEPYIILDEADQNNFRHLAQIIRDHVVGHASKKRLRATPPAPYGDSTGRNYGSAAVSFEALYRDRNNVSPQLMEGIRQYANAQIRF